MENVQMLLPMEPAKFWSQLKAIVEEVIEQKNTASPPSSFGQKYSNQPLLKVSEVCQAKGCWMNLTSGADSTHVEMFVQFKDYGFFMPKDLAGKEVIVEGKAYKEATSVEELRHYAEDAGKTEEEIAAITEPQMEKKFLATGVVLVKSEK